MVDGAVAVCAGHSCLGTKFFSEMDELLGSLLKAVYLAPRNNSCCLNCSRVLGVRAMLLDLSFRFLQFYSISNCVWN